MARTSEGADLFAGVGGFTEAAEQLGLLVRWAANHWHPSVYWHTLNHPTVTHACQDLQQTDFSILPALDFVLASPACQGHSPAGQPARSRSKRASAKHDADRSTAWAVITCVEVTRPRFVVVENTPAFQRWALHGVWKSAFERLGYTLTELLLDAADFGVPQNRRRYFCVALCRRRVVDVEPTVSEYTPSATIIDPNAEGWTPVSTKSEQVRERVAKGRARCGRRFFTQHVTGHPGRSLDEPLATVTTVAHHWNLVDGDMMRPLTVRELARACSFRDTYQLPTDLRVGTKLVGNAVPPLLARAVIEQARAAA